MKINIIGSIVTCCYYLFEKVFVQIFPSFGFAFAPGTYRFLSVSVITHNPCENKACVLLLKQVVQL